MSTAREPSRLLSSLPILAALVVGSACAGPDVDDESSRARAFYDRPHPVPVGVPYEGAEQPSPEPQPITSAEECGRGHGFDPDGNCVQVTLRELEFGGMVQIPGGAFLRGDLPTRYDARAGRKRPHIQHSGQPMWLDRLPSFWMDGTEVSREAYVKCVEAGACTPAICLDGGDGRPTEQVLDDRTLAMIPQTCVTHAQAAAYCEWRGARLPTEGEWEYAARGPQGSIYPWGNQLRDEVGLALGPIGFDPFDVSYFGLKGFAGNVVEWVADRFEPDANLNQYLAGPFRKDDGPLARSFTEWIRGLCEGSDCKLGERYVVKGGRVGARTAAWQLARGVTLAEIPEENFEGDRIFTHNRRLGFRCAADLEPDRAPLTEPKPPAPLPLYRSEGGFDLFLGIVEAVDREEAERFCAQLVAPGDPEQLPPGGNGWRLPTLEELRDVVWYGGPGPFWVAEGAAEQAFAGTREAAWDMVEADADEALMARCIRSR